MTINKKYGQLEFGKFEYAPNSFDIGSGVLINPPEEFYLEKGYCRVIDDMPEPEPNCYVKFDRYVKDDEAKTITFEYVQIMIPIVREQHIYSKLYLELALFKLDLLQKFNDFIDTTMISNEYGTQVPLRQFYDQANELNSTNEYFEQYKKEAQEKLGIDDETLNAILEAAEVKGN